MQALHCNMKTRGSWPNRIRVIQLQTSGKGSCHTIQRNTEEIQQVAAEIPRVQILAIAGGLGAWEITL
jgi:hypothetical protein